VTVPQPSRLGRRLHQLFEVSLLAKGLFALTELVSGIVLYFVKSDAVTAAVGKLTFQELSEDPTDIIANTLLRLSQDFSIESQQFYSYYLASHGVVKLAMVLALARKFVWAYPAAIVVQFAFIAYQIYRYTFAPSWGLILLTAFDLIVIALIWREYRTLPEVGANAG